MVLVQVGTWVPNASKFCR